MRPLTKAPIPHTLLAVAAAVAATACASSRETAPDRARKPVAAADFADPDATRLPPGPQTPPIVPREQASAGRGDLSVTPDAPDHPAAAVAPITQPATAAPPPRQEQRYVVDDMVGQINGDPVYADEFFEPMDARLRQEARRLPIRQWIGMVREDVSGKLWNQVQDELLLSEFQTNLSAEQRVGVLAFIEDLRKDIQRSYGGSSEVANERLQAEEGVTLREKVQDDAERQFIIAQLRSTIAKRVQVSFKDIQLYYQQNIDRFRPAPEAVFRVIRVPLSRTSTIDEVAARLEDGDDPRAVAAEYSTWAADEDNEHRVELVAHDYANTTFWGHEGLNDATQALQPGTLTPRIDIGSSAWWIYLEQIHQPEGKSLYEAQLEIEQIIRAQRIRQEQQRYFQSLLARSNVTEFDQMVERLVAYAAERYYVRRIYQGEEIPLRDEG